MSETRVTPEYRAPPEDDHGLVVDCPDCGREFYVQDSGECIFCGAEYETVVEFDE